MGLFKKIKNYFYSPTVDEVLDRDLIDKSTLEKCGSINSSISDDMNKIEQNAKRRRNENDMSSLLSDTFNDVKKIK